MIQTARGALERDRRTVGAAQSGEHEALAQIGLAGPTHVVADEEVEFAVIVVIEEPATGAPLIAVSIQPGFRGDVAKLAAAQVLEEPVPTDPRDKHVDEPVVVVVAHGHTHGVHRDVESRSGGNVRKAALAVVTVEFQGRGCRRSRSIVWRRVPGPG